MTTQSWQPVRLGDVLRVHYGKALPPTLRAIGLPVPVVGSAGVMAQTSDALVNGPVIVIGRKGNVGAVHLCDSGAWPTDTTYYIVPSDQFDARFLAHQLGALELRQYNSSTAVPSLRRSDLEERLLVRPPVDEQRRIVEILEDHLSRLDAALGSLSAIDARLEALRISNLSERLFGHETWPYRRLGDVLAVSIGGIWGFEAGLEEVDANVLRVTELKAGGRMVPETAARRSMTGTQLARRELQVGDLLLEKSGGGPTQPVGRVGYVDRLCGRSTCSNFMQLLRVNPGVVVPRFLFWYLTGFYLQGGTDPMQKASTNIRNLKSSEYLKIAVPLPPLHLQASIAVELDTTATEEDRLLAECRLAHVRETRLRRALLTAAFSGRLAKPADVEAIEDLIDV